MLLHASDVRRGDFVAIGSLTTSTSRVVTICAIPPEVVISTRDRASGDRAARAHLDELPTLTVSRPNAAAVARPLEETEASEDDHQRLHVAHREGLGPLGGSVAEAQVG